MPPPTGVVSGALDRNLVRLRRLERIRREPLAGLVLRLLAGQDLEPDDALPVAERLLDGRIEDPHRRAPDVAADAVAFDEGNDGIVGHDQRPVAPAGDRRAFGRRNQIREFGHDAQSRPLWPRDVPVAKTDRTLRSSPCGPSQVSSTETVENLVEESVIRRGQPASSGPFQRLAPSLCGCPLPQRPTGTSRSPDIIL